MDEFEFIKSIQQKSYVQPSLIKGIGDDAAVFRQSYQDTVMAVDTFVENIHFSRKTMHPFHVGYRVLAANISDMAAMGCDPAYYLISIVIPESWAEDELSEIYRGMKEIATEYKMDLIGGDTVSGNELVISVTIVGFVAKGSSRYRSSAQDNDKVFVTGTLGDSAAGYYLLTNESDGEIGGYDYFVNRHRMPKPRIAFAKWLESLSRISLNDISDGIGNEAAEIAEASKVSIHLDYSKIPYHHDLEYFTQEQQKKWKLFGGEDFELIGTVSEKEWPLVVEAGKQTNTKVTEIGYVKDNVHSNNSVFLYEDSKVTKLDKLGYTHLK
ncbi:thiamine-phosphate kinase [Aquibacillus halophilus]|uniref:Thiamine-monophosphate kinase n=1 Tax=Aquibacillus halophilus TaxID=930132 RepID=A0A6A8DK68_9BACI|nr:thiamine-phosphate kinase [Aquibacillus halophilus]MRH44876.1 thiamine-phosphate kinase [Aquibacillus halophilus]